MMSNYQKNERKSVWQEKKNYKIKDKRIIYIYIYIYIL